jgi:copper(I)-binding protein
MLFDLKKTLAVGESVNFVLYFKAKNKTEFKQNIKALVRAEKEQQH